MQGTNLSGEQPSEKALQTFEARRCQELEEKKNEGKSADNRYDPLSHPLPIAYYAVVSSAQKLG